MDTTPEPPSDGGNLTEATTMHEPVLRKGYEPNIALEREPPEASEQRCDLATLCDVLGALLEFKGMPSLCCLTSVPRLLLLCFPSVVWIHLRPSGIQLLLEECVPWLRLKLLIPSFHLGPLSRLLHLGSSLPQLHLGASALQLQWAPSILRLHLGQTSPRLHHGLASCSVSPPLRSVWLCPPSGSTSGPQLLLTPLVPRFLLGWCGSVTAARFSGVTESHQGSTTIGSISIACPYDVEEGFSTMFPPSVDAAVGLLPGWTLGSYIATHAPGSLLATPSLHFRMDCVVCP